MKIAVAGAGAFGEKHLEALKDIDGVEVVSLIGGTLAATEQVAAKYRIGHVSTRLDDALARSDVDAVILCTPTQLHARQAIACLNAGKHVQVEIPLADSLADAEAVMQKCQDTGLIGMVGHTRRFNPSHQYIHKKIGAGELAIQQMDVQTYFFRRANINAKGEPRDWTDHLLCTTPRIPWTCSPIRQGRSWRRGHWQGRPTRTWASPWICRSSSRATAARSARFR